MVHSPIRKHLAFIVALAGAASGCEPVAPPPRASTQHKDAPANHTATPEPVNDPPAKDAEAPAQSTGTPKTALVTFPDIFCRWTEQSAPYAYIGFALVFDGKVRYFKTKTTCKDFDSWRPMDGMSDPYKRAMLGEQVVVYETNVPMTLRRENGASYPIETSESSTTRSYLLPHATGDIYDAIHHESNPHPKLVLEECRKVTTVAERDRCLWHQAGRQINDAICDELSETLRPNCKKWVDNVRNGKVNK